MAFWTRGGTKNSFKTGFGVSTMNAVTSGSSRKDDKISSIAKLPL